MTKQSRQGYNSRDVGTHEAISPCDKGQAMIHSMDMIFVFMRNPLTQFRVKFGKYVDNVNLYRYFQYALLK